MAYVHGAFHRENIMPDIDLTALRALRDKWRAQFKEANGPLARAASDAIRHAQNGPDGADQRELSAAVRDGGKEAARDVAGGMSAAFH